MKNDFSSTPLVSGRFAHQSWLGLALVVGLHLLLGWALLAGLSRPSILPAKPPVQVALVAEAPPPSPPPPPPELRIVPKTAPAAQTVRAPPWVPPPVVVPAATELPSPAAITPTPPAPPLPTLPEPPPVVAAAPAVVTPPARTTAQEMGVVCPHQVKPTMPQRALQEGTGGFVKVMATVRGGKVVAVEVLSSKPRGLFEASVRKAMMQYRCESPPDADIKVPQEFNFTVTEE